MRYGIISDIHGNLEALKEVVDACEREGVEQYLCVGDIMGYGANPNECMELICKLNTLCVAGNHDWAVSGKLDASYFIPEGKEAIAWTRENLDMNGFNFLNSLKLVERNDDIILVHGTLSDPKMFEYLDDIVKSADSFELMERPVCFIGHTHVPMILIQYQKQVYISGGLEVELDSQAKYIVNVGSVGQPRDRNPMASFCIYDTDMKMIEVKRVQYDIQSAQKKIIEAGLPELLANRLSVGR